MRNIHLIEQFMKENDIEYDVPFTVDFKLKNRIESENLKICLAVDRGKLDSGKYTAVLKKIVGNEEIECSRDTLLAIMFNDVLSIRKKPWKPKKNEKYYFINVHNNIDYDWFDNAFVCDRYRYITGNFFKTYNEAEKHKDKMLKILKGEPLVKWED